MLTAAVSGGVLSVIAFSLAKPETHQVTESPAVIRASSDPYFHWARDQTSDRLHLEVRPNPRLRSISTIPPVPAGGSIRIFGETGTVGSGAIVQVLNQRSGKAGTAVASSDGSFEMELEALAGDELRILSLAKPRVQTAPDPVISLQ